MQSFFLTLNSLQSGRGKFGKHGLAASLEILEMNCAEFAEQAAAIVQSGKESEGRRLGSRMADMFAEHGVTRAIAPAIRLAGSYQVDWVKECESLAQTCVQVGAEAREIRARISEEISVDRSSAAFKTHIQDFRQELESLS